MYNQLDFIPNHRTYLAKLEELKERSFVKGILPTGAVEIINLKWHGTAALELTYKNEQGKPENTIIYRDREPVLEVIEAGLQWSFDAEGDKLKLASEAKRISLAHIFDPYLAVHTSLVDPLPHQITAVYGEMLTRQPLRFLLADDPGAGKTIMAGLFIKELIARGDLKRCLIVCPGSLVEQWQDELNTKFHLPFEIMTNDKLESARTGNWFQETDLVISRLDILSRNEDVRAKLDITDWDLIIVDEAHKMSASFFGGEAKYTKRFMLGRELSKKCRHFLLMTATPHNGKEEDFQLFMSLLDGDRFEGKFRDGVHTVDVKDVMRRMVKEQLLKFDSTPLFPERFAYTATYQLSDQEAALYAQVTSYVKEEFNRAESLENEGRKGTVGFALTILQRRLASSPEAIYQSLKRRREKLELKLQAEKLQKRGDEQFVSLTANLPALTDSDIEEIEDEAEDSEVQKTADLVVDEATAARTIAELQAEITELKRLESLALTVRLSRKDKKWEEVSRILQENPQMFDAAGNRRKLVIFTEHRDTLNYLTERIGTLLGKNEALVTIQGQMGREDRKKSELAFKQDKNVEVLLATDAAGEGINLQRAHLMINYDLPWNPNRLEQRFGRIHRIGQKEVCHLWNLVAEETREGEVFIKLLQKLQNERERLGGAVFDVLGRIFQGTELRKLLIEAIRYGERPDVKEKLSRVIEGQLDTEKLKELISERALVHDSMDVTRVMEIRNAMERAETRKLQPHFIASFFIEAFQLLGGSIHEREKKRYEITHVPATIRQRDRAIGIGTPVLPRYERVTFEKGLVAVDGKPVADFLCPGHPLLDSVIDIILERYRALLKTGAALVDTSDYSQDIRALFYLENSIQDARLDAAGTRRSISKQIHFVEVGSDKSIKSAGYAPYLDYRPASQTELAVLKPIIEKQWMGKSLEGEVISYAIEHVIPRHLEEVKSRKDELILKTRQAIYERLTKEINYWDNRANQLREKEIAGKTPELNSRNAQERANNLQYRLQKRMEELDLESKISAVPPVVIGGALIIPIGLINKLMNIAANPDLGTADKEVELKAMAAVMQKEKGDGFEPRDVSAQKLGYDIESLDPQTKRLRFIEVKGRRAGAATVTITKNEILTALNKPEQFILAVVEVDGDNSQVAYLKNLKLADPGFAATSVNYNIGDLKDISA